MNQHEREVFKRLGIRGLARALDETLDPGRLVRLANACKLRYPGMRTQSQKRSRIVTDLVERAQGEEPVRRAIYKALQKETARLARDWAALDPQERARRLDAEQSLKNGKLGAHLFVLADSVEEEARAGFAEMLAREERLPPLTDATRPREAATPSRDQARLQKKSDELHKKVKHLEAQLAKLRDTEKQLKREGIQRKGELAESRMLAERLRRELQSLGGGTDRSDPPAPTPAPAMPPAFAAALEELAKTVRKLSAEQRKLAHAVEKAVQPVAPPTASAAHDALAPVLEAVEEIKKEIAAHRRDRKKEAQQDSKRLEEMRVGLVALKSAIAEGTTSTGKRTRRPRGERERIGVFVDVQNMYYSARQLKGKLDFDALLQTVVRDRRLIQAKAYVVESKEIDQSGFIAMLQQRAIEVRRKTLKVRSDGSMKGDWDMEMALEILDAAPSLDVVVLVSGDGDFTSLVNRVKGMGPRVEVVAFPRNTAKSLLEAADQFTPLDRKFMIRAAARAGQREADEADSGKQAASSAGQS